MARLDAQLLERDDDLREAAGLLAAAGHGGGSTLLIEGPAGIGKSALIRVPARVRIPVSRRAKRMVKRGAQRGRETRGGVVTIGRDSACFKNRAHSSRQFTLVP